MNRTAWVAVTCTAITGVAAAIGATRASRGNEVRCAPPFVVAGWRCCDTKEARDGICARSTAPTQRWVRVPATRLVLGPSDWEAEGRLSPRVIDVPEFELDAHEVHVEAGDDGARALAGLSFADAFSRCSARGARVPTEDEWIAAASGPNARRYPWGDTGAVCRRGVWGLSTGPCALAATGPDSVGAHPDGATSLGLEDMAGNVAEWTTRDGSAPVAHGGSWASALATEIRTWSPLEIDPTSHDARVGVRCARDVNPVDSTPP